MSFFTQLETFTQALGVDPLRQGLQLLDAQALMVPPAAPPTSARDGAWAEVQGLGPYIAPLVPFPLVPTRPALIWGNANITAEPIATTLRERYPADHPVVLARSVSATVQIQHITLSELAGQELDAATGIYLAPLEPLADLRGPDGLHSVLVRLLGPQGCPWDRDQTHQSLRPALLEEAHEVLEALDSGDMAALSEEMGDLLLSILAHSEMARQAGHFGLGDVYEQIAAKLIRRHPHVFGSTVVSDSGEVVQNWDAIKQAERAGKGQQARGTLDGIPPSMPALATAQKLSHKAAKAGFEWPAISGAWDKVLEEIAELREAAESGAVQPQRVEEELGDVLFALAALSRWLHVDSESALRAANAKFRRRFAAVEQHANGRSLKTFSIDELIALWREAKAGVQGSGARGQE